ncbi:hypothetical protein E2C01_056121 [Portunus trituberculatus]|uniref:Uncharacterized protein n=1 Tax=Portunus trituberculatus TaxID=210409 RepID=A0A5B7GPH9_PORTR|nr:hypothetical protein [Portunus trituberculatus]
MASSDIWWRGVACRGVAWCGVVSDNEVWSQLARCGVMWRAGDREAAVFVTLSGMWRTWPGGRPYKDKTTPPLPPATIIITTTTTTTTNTTKITYDVCQHHHCNMQ